MPEDWQRVGIVLTYKGKGSKPKCMDCLSISLLRIHGKVYGRIIIQRVINEKQIFTGEEKCKFWLGMECVEQIINATIAK